MQTVADIFEAFGGIAALGREIDTELPHATVRSWKLRGAIPSEYWLALVGAAKERGFDWITLELLSEQAQARRQNLEAAE